MSLFWISIVLFVAVIFIGNYLMFNRVLPAINESIESLPSGQIKQVELYLSKLSTRQRRGFSYLFLKNHTYIQAVMGLLLVINIIYYSVFG